MYFSFFLNFSFSWWKFFLSTFLWYIVNSNVFFVIWCCNLSSFNSPIFNISFFEFSSICISQSVFSVWIDLSNFIISFGFVLLNFSIFSDLIVVNFAILPSLYSFLMFFWKFFENVFSTWFDLFSLQSLFQCPFSLHW